MQLDMVRTNRGSVTNVFPGHDNPMFVSKQLARRKEISPDLRELRMTNEHLVFVYGTLMKGHHNHYLVEKSKYLGRARTFRDEYVMYTARAFPVTAEVGKEAGEYVFGECYAVNNDTMMNLDHLENNGSMYTRKEIRVKLMDQHVDQNIRTSKLEKAWCYLGSSLEDNGYWDFKNMAKMPLDTSTGSYLDAGYRWEKSGRAFN